MAKIHISGNICINTFNTPNLGNYSLYELTFGRKPKLLIDVESNPDSKVSRSFREYYKLLNKRIKYLQDILFNFKSRRLAMISTPLLDKNTNAQSYMHLQARKPYIAINSETYISLRQQELRSCKRIGYKFYCEELFVVKHKSSYSCESAIYFNLTTDNIKNNWNFNFNFNKTDITPTVLDGGDETVLANWPNDKHIICNVNNDIPVKLPSHPYVLVNRSGLCNCSTEAANHYLLESIAACDNRDSKLIMYFTVNMAFANYLDMFPNLT